MSVIKTPTGHEDSVHDAQLDYYGLRLATCSSDHVVKIFDVISQNGSAPSVVFSCNLLGHTGPVWEVAWAHPRWGTLLASCSYDSSVVIHRQSEQTGVWEEAYRFNANASVNTIEWCPIEYGLALALASSDGTVSILRGESGGAEWKVETTFLADKLGLNSVSWAPFGSLGSVNPHDGTTILRIACGGSDEQVKIYKCEWAQDEVSLPQWQTEKPEFVLKGHRGWVRDVAFCPSVGLPYNLLATCSEDGTVKLWNQEKENGDWIAQDLHDFAKPVWRLAWSVSGSLLAVSAGEDEVSLWKESIEAKKWIQVLQPQDAPLVAAEQQQQPIQVEHKLDQFVPEEEEPVSEEAPATAPVGAKQEAWTEVPSVSAPSTAAAAVEEEEDEKGWDDNLDDVQVDEEPAATAKEEEPQPQQQGWDEQQQPQQQGWDEQQQQGWEGQEQQQGWDEQQQPQQGWDEQQQPQQGWDEQQQGGWEGQQQQEGWEGQQQQEGWEGQQQQGWEGQEGWDQQGWDHQAWDQQQQEGGSWEGQEWTPEQIAEWEQQQQQQQQWDEQQLQ